MKDQESGGESEMGGGVRCEHMGFLPDRWLVGWRGG